MHFHEDQVCTLPEYLLWTTAKTWLILIDAYTVYGFCWSSPYPPPSLWTKLYSQTRSGHVSWTGWDTKYSLPFCGQWSCQWWEHMTGARPIRVTAQDCIQLELFEIKIQDRAIHSSGHKTVILVQENSWLTSGRSLKLIATKFLLLQSKNSDHDLLESSDIQRWNISFSFYVDTEPKQPVS